MQALASILLPHSSEEECRDAPCIVLLFAEPVLGLDDKLLRFKNLAAGSLYHTLHVDGQDLEKTLSMLFVSFGDLHRHPIFNNLQNMTALIDFWHADHSVADISQPQGIITVVQELCQFFCRRGLRVFVKAALKDAYERREDVLFVTRLLNSVALFPLRETDTNPSFYSKIVSEVITLAKHAISASTAMPSGLRDSIIEVIQKMAHHLGKRKTWANRVVNGSTSTKVAISSEWAKRIWLWPTRFWRMCPRPKRFSLMRKEG